MCFQTKGIYKKYCLLYGYNSETTTEAAGEKSPNKEGSMCHSVPLDLTFIFLLSLSSYSYSLNRWI
jgi:hypothetical protein